MQSLFLYKLLQIALLRVIPSYHNQIFANSVVYGSGRKLGIGNEPALAKGSVFASVIVDIILDIIEARLHIQHYLEIRLGAKLIVELGLSHNKFLLCPSYHVYLVRHAATQHNLPRLGMEPLRLEDFCYEVLKGKPRWSKIHYRPAKRIAMGERTI